MDFTVIVIDAKGGGESRFNFDKDEITIGRVQGNDVILSRGNVSKRHARIVAEHGEFVVVDLKSTNGTFVNGRRIGGPQAISIGDKVYVGDFVLGVEGATGAAGKPPPPPRDDKRPGTIAVAEDDVMSSDDLSDLIPENRKPPVRKAGSSDDSAYITGRSHSAFARMDDVPALTQPPALPVPPSLVPEDSPPAETTQRPHDSLLEHVMERIASEFDLASDRFIDAEDSSLRPAVETVIRDLVSQLLDANAIPDSVDAESVVRDALDQALGLGPLGNVLNDPDIREIWLSASGSLMVLRGTRRVVLPDKFISIAAAELAVRRLARTSIGAPGPRAVDQADPCKAAPSGFVLRLPNGARAVGAVERESGGPYLHIWSPRAAVESLATLVKRGAMAQEVADFLKAAIANRRTVLVAGVAGAGADAVGRALACTFPGSEWTLSVSLNAPATPELNSLTLDFGTLPFGARDTLFARWDAALRTHPERLFIDDLGDEWTSVLAADLARVLQAGRGGSVITWNAGSIEQALARWVGVLEESGLSESVARELLVSAIQFVVLVQPGTSGSRSAGVVARVADFTTDLSGAFAFRDLFSFRVEGSRPGSGGATTYGRELYAAMEKRH